MCRKLLSTQDDVAPLVVRVMIGSIDALDYFRQWRTPEERLEE
jgi:hypothetical protein